MNNLILLLLSLSFANTLSAQCWEEISTNGQFAIARKGDETLWSWGRNNYGQLGDGTNTDKLQPIQIGTSANWKYGSCGGGHGMGIKADGSLWAWGWNDYGQLGNGTYTSSNTPIQIPGNWKQVSAGMLFTAAVTQDGKLFLWGDNNSHQVSPSNITTVPSPLQYGTDTDWKEVYVGDASVFALKNNGTLWTWGNNAYGMLGHGTSGVPVATPMQIDAGAGNFWTKVSAGGLHAIALKSDKTIWGAGQNFVGSLGTGNNTDSHVFIQIGTDNNWIDIDAGLQHSTATNENYELWTWGDNWKGQLGDGSTNDSNIPIQVAGINNASKISAGSRVSSVLTFDGKIQMCGENNYGVIADGTTTDRSSFYELQASYCTVLISTENTASFEHPRVSAYPSPANHILNIDYSQNDITSPLSVNFYTVEGKLVLTTDKITNIDISSMPNGLYYFKLITEKTILVGNFVKNTPH